MLILQIIRGIPLIAGKNSHFTVLRDIFELLLPVGLLKRLGTCMRTFRTRLDVFIVVKEGFIN